MGCLAPRPGRFTPRERDPVPIVQEAGWAPGAVWTAAENLAPPGFDPRTVQPVASRYTDWAIVCQVNMQIIGKLCCGVQCARLVPKF
jgi:hypothetical protein